MRIGVAVAVIGGAQALEPEWGWCGAGPPVMQNFDVQRYLGTWYEIRRDKRVFYEQGKDCQTAHYTFRPKNWFYQIGVNNGSVLRETGALRNSYNSG